MGDRRATLKDVAAASGVSPTTVSFVLNRTAGQTISATTRERVEQAAHRLGYSPHGAARALREGTSRIVVLSTPRAWSGGSLQGFVRGMREELDSHSYALVLHAADAPQRGTRQELARDLAGLRPFAVLDLATAYAGGDDEADGGWTDGLASHSLTQLRYLSEGGHRHIALALPAREREGRVRTVRRRSAHLAAERLGLPPLHELPLHSDAERAASALSALRSTAPEITAVAGFDDETSLAVLAAMHDLRLPVPSALAVIGFDESRHGALWRPALTTVRIEAETFGRRAARSVLGLELGDWAVAPSTVVERETA